MNHPISPYLYVSTLFENNDLLSKRNPKSELLLNQILIISTNTLVNILVYKQGQVFILWASLDSLNLAEFEDKVQCGYFDLRCILQTVALTNQHFFFLNENFDLKVIRIADILNQTLFIADLYTLNASPKVFKASISKNITIFEEKGETKVLRLEQDKNGQVISYKKYTVEKYRIENCYFVSKEEPILYSMAQQDEKIKSDIHFKFFSQSLPTQEIWFYHLSQYLFDDKDDSLNIKFLCSFSCESPITLIDLNQTGEKMIFKLLNGLLFVVQNIFDKDSQVHYGKLKLIGSDFQIKLMDNLPLICCYEKGILIFLDNELNLLKSFKDNNISLNPISFLTEFPLDQFEELSLFSYIKDTDVLTIRYLATKKVINLQQSSIIEELIYYFFEKERLDLALSVVKEKRKANSKNIEELESLLVCQFEEYFSRIKDGADMIVNYFLQENTSQKNSKHRNLLTQQIIMIFLHENDVENAYQLAKGTSNIVGLTHIKDYCQQTGFFQLHEKVENKIYRILERKYGINKQALKELKHLKNIDSLDVLVPFDVKLKSFLQTLNLSENDSL